MMMFDDKVGGWGWLNDDVIKKYTYKGKNFVCVRRKQGWNLKNKPPFLCSNLSLISLIQVTDVFLEK